MLFAFLVGLLAAFGNLPWWGGLLLVALLVLFKGTLEVQLKNHWWTGGESPYAFYLHNLEASGGVPRLPWLGYLVQMVLYGVPIGTAGFLLGALFR